MPERRPSCLIVGGDSRLSQVLKPQLQSAGYDVVRTTRRAPPNDALLLDFADVDSFKMPPHITHAAIVGGVVDYKVCDNQYDYAFDINCRKIPALVGRLLEAGVFVCCLSTNTVFTPSTVPAREYDIHNPAINYALLKSKFEHQILTEAFRRGKSDNLAILRLTKNIGETTSPFNAWIAWLAEGKSISAFDDLYFAPVLFSRSAEAVREIFTRNLSGMFHMSGERDLNYVEFAAGLLRALGLPASLLNASSSTKAGMKLNYNHPITALNMELTSERLGLKPVAASEIYDYLGGLYRQKRGAA